MTHSWNYKPKQAAAYIKNKLSACGCQPRVFITLGSGFRDVADSWQSLAEIPMIEIPGYPAPTVPGHGGRLLAVRISFGSSTQDALVATGRTHLYEGRDPFDVALPVFIAHELGIKFIILTNAAGGLTEAAKTGSVIAISDHMNLTGQNVSASVSRDAPVKFIDMNNA